MSLLRSLLWWLRRVVVVDLVVTAEVVAGVVVAFVAVAFVVCSLIVAEALSRRALRCVHGAGIVIAGMVIVEVVEKNLLLKCDPGNKCISDLQISTL